MTMPVAIVRRWMFGPDKPLNFKEGFKTRIIIENPLYSHTYLHTYHAPSSMQLDEDFNLGNFLVASKTTCSSSDFDIGLPKKVMDLLRRPRIVIVGKCLAFLFLSGNVEPI